ncbi:MAG: DUF692 domain-containing protein [Planctomycetes bacterium]|nr:DUF692 domain-containing protein [Planctomycetota bacterium]MCC7399740.1 DUF692 family protein [Planctomycetota bacterium]
MSRVEVGFSLQPDAEYLDLLGPVLPEVDYFEVAPETTWRRDEAGRWAPNGFHREFLRLGQVLQKPFVGHAVAGSFGTVGEVDRARQQEWQQRLVLDQRAFAFRWLSDHLGAAVLDGRAVALPIALPMNESMAAVVRARLVALQQVVADVGIENSVFYFLLGDWLDEPAFLARILQPKHTHLLLDLHNVFTMAENVGADAERYLAALDCDRVIEIHLSGGSHSDARWLPDGRVLRLDSHDHAVPEPVWRLFERVLPRCRRLRGVTLERIEGTVHGAADVDELRSELRRIREVLRGRS